MRKDNRTTTYIRNGALPAVECASIPPLKEKEGVRMREGGRERDKNREMESAEGFESTAQIAHKVLNHACTVHTHMNINTFFRSTISYWELKNAPSLTQILIHNHYLYCVVGITNCEIRRLMSYFKRCMSVLFLLMDISIWSVAIPRHVFSFPSLFLYKYILHYKGGLENVWHISVLWIETGAA